jgi:hypothetical protein
MSSGAMMYIPNFIKIDSGFQKLTGKIQRQEDIMVIPKAYFSK